MNKWDEHETREKVQTVNAKIYNNNNNNRGKNL